LITNEHHHLRFCKVSPATGGGGSVGSQATLEDNGLKRPETSAEVKHVGSWYMTMIEWALQMIMIMLGIDFVLIDLLFFMKMTALRWTIENTVENMVLRFENCHLKAETEIIALRNQLKSGDRE
jgi:hypothetical protein